MKHLLFTFLLATLCAIGYGQTIKSLGYNTNGQVVYTGNNVLQFTNTVNFNTVDASGVQINGALFFYDQDGTGEIFQFDGGAPDEARARQNLGLGGAWLTNTNVTNFRTAIGVSPATIWAYKATNQTNTTTNLVSDTALTFTAAANTKYAVELFLVIGDGADGISAFFASSNSPSLFGFWAYVEPANNIYGTTANAITNEAFLISADSGDPTSFVQKFVAVGPTNTNATITFQFRKASTDGTAVIGAGSYLKAEVIE
jgi:hypothetical protein